MQAMCVKRLWIIAGIGFSELAIGSEVDLWTGKNAGFGDVFFPHFHVAAVTGRSSMDPADLALNAHDPVRSGFDLLALEPAMSLRLGDHLEGFVVNSYLTDSEGDFTGGVEEAFLKLKNLPGGFELRGGRFFNRTGFQNAHHNHAWDFLDQNLSNSRLLQEGELGTIGGEVTWHLPLSFPAAVSIAVGAPPSSHGHDHGHEEGEEEEHGHEEEGFEAEEAFFDDYIVSANLLADWRYNDFHRWRGTAYYATGRNGFERRTHVVGAGIEYLWRANGLEPGGSYFWWRTEAMWRTIDVASHENEHGHEEEEHEDEEEHEGEEHDGDHPGSFDEFGITSSVAYGFNDHWEASLRAGFVSGIDEMGLDERWRLSPTLTWSLNREQTVKMRLQYNYDHSNDFGDAHSIWLGLNFNWGGPEVR